MHEPARPALLLFPRFGGAVGIEAMGEGEAFVRLTEASTNYVALGEAGFAALTRLVRETPAFGVTYPDSAAGIALVEQLGEDRQSVVSGKSVSVSVDLGGRRSTKKKKTDKKDDQIKNT